MKRTLLLLALPLLAGCPKAGSKAPKDPATDVLSTWARKQLDLRTWRSCARAAQMFDLESAVVVFPVDTAGKVGTVSIEPAEMAHDPAMICLQMELAHPPTDVPHEGEAREIRLRAGVLHELPSAAGS